MLICQHRRYHLPPSSSADKYYTSLHQCLKLDMGICLTTNACLCRIVSRVTIKHLFIMSSRVIAQLHAYTTYLSYSLLHLSHTDLAVKFW